MTMTHLDDEPQPDAFLDQYMEDRLGGGTYEEFPEGYGDDEYWDYDAGEWDESDQDFVLA